MYPGRYCLKLLQSRHKLEQGQTVFTPLNIRSANIRYYKNSIQQTDQQQKSLPAGTYVYCVSVATTSGVVLGESCEEITLSLVTPTILIFPANEAELDYTLPFFYGCQRCLHRLRWNTASIWLRAYDQQTPEDAILRNPLVYSFIRHWYQFITISCYCICLAGKVKKLCLCR